MEIDRRGVPQCPRCAEHLVLARVIRADSVHTEWLCPTCGHTEQRERRGATLRHDDPLGLAAEGLGKF